MSVSTIRTGLQARLATIIGLNVYAVHPDTITVPAAVVRPDQRMFSLSMGSAPSAANTIVFVVTLYAAAAQNGLALGQQTLDAYLDDSGASSVKAAIEAEPTLGGTVTTCRVVRWYDYDTYSAADIEYVACRFEVEVWP